MRACQPAGRDRQVTNEFIAPDTPPRKPIRILVCGGRNYARRPKRGAPASEWEKYWAERQMLGRVLNVVNDWHDVTAVIHGDAPGADQAAGNWGLSVGVEVIPFPAHWTEEGRSAGPRRNQRMLDEGAPDLIVAFPGGAGTEDMVSRGIKAGVAVLRA